jgi:hypothetical protein
MNFLATLRHQQRTQARTVLGLLVVVWLNLTLQGCATASPDTLLVDRPVASSELDFPRTHSSHAQPEQCPFCEHERCTEGTPCDGPVTAGTKAETRLFETHEFESTAAASIDDLDLAVISPNICLVRPKNRVTAAAVPLHIQHCVYLT